MVISAFSIFYYIKIYSAPKKYPDHFESAPITDQSEASITRVVDFAELQSKNDEIYAWILIPGTKINYPVVQSKDNNNFYLNHDEYGKNAVYGAIYTENRNTTTFKDYNTLIYGHNMLNGSMFTDTLKYGGREFFDSHREIYIYTPEKAYKYKVFAAYAADDSHVLMANDFSTADGYGDYLNKIRAEAKGIYDQDAAVTVQDKIITLSTCYSGGKLRFLTQAVLEATMNYIQ